MHGIPNVWTGHNGQPFKERSFTELPKEHGLDHHASIPHSLKSTVVFGVKIATKKRFLPDLF